MKLRSFLLLIVLAVGANLTLLPSTIACEAQHNVLTEAAASDLRQSYYQLHDIGLPGRIEGGGTR